MAKRTVKECVEQAREILQDVGVDLPFRYSTTDLLSYFNNAQYELKRLYPAAYLGRFGQDLTLYTEADWDTEIPFASIFFQPTAIYIAGYAELRDDEFVTEARAATLLSGYVKQLTMPASGVVA
jgi:hypothetical protein